MKYSTLISLIVLNCLSALALEPENPVALCERFLEGSPRLECQKKMEQWKPDWYAATTCNGIFDDKIFYECVDFSRSQSFLPKKLEECQGDQLTDLARLQCVKAAQTVKEKAFQSPAQRSSSQKKN